MLSLKQWSLSIALLLTIIGIFFRFHNLGVIPPGLYHDEAKNGNDAITTFIENEYHLFYPDNYGREGMFIWLQAIAFRLLGISTLTLRSVSAVIGILTIIATYFLASEMVRHVSRKTIQSEFSRILIPLLATLFITASFWHIHFSRTSFRGILTPLLLTVGFYFFYRSIRDSKKILIVLSGVSFGIGAYAHSMMFFGTLIPITLLLIIFIHSRYKNKPRKAGNYTVFLILFTGTALVVALPMLVYAMTHLNLFLQRASTLSVSQTDHPLITFLQNIISHAGMFNVSGDAYWLLNFSGRPQLEFMVGVLFLVGIYYAIRQGKILFQKNIEEALVFIGPVLWLMIMLIPASLTIENIPHALRTIGVIPAVFILAAYGCIPIINFIEKKFVDVQIQKLVLLSSILFFGTYLCVSQYLLYQYDYAKHPAVIYSFQSRYVAIGKLLNSLPNSITAYIILNDDKNHLLTAYPDSVADEKLAMTGQPILFIQASHNISIQNTRYVKDVSAIPEILSSTTVIVPMVVDEDMKRAIENKFGDGNEASEPLFWYYVINRPTPR